MIFGEKNYKFKLNHSAVQTMQNINEVLDKRSMKVNKVQHWFKKLQRFLHQDKDSCGWCPSVADDQLKAILELDPIEMTRKIANKLNVDHFNIIRHLEQISKVKN